MKKVSFDFDNTLEHIHVQKYAKKLIDNNYDVHIVTSRPEKWNQKWSLRGNPYSLWDNDDLYEVAKKLNIKKENIHFTNYTPKYKFFDKEKDFIFHLDDDYNETFFINKNTKTKAVTLDNENYKEECDEILFIDKFTDIKNANISPIS